MAVLPRAATPPRVTTSRRLTVANAPAMTGAIKVASAVRVMADRAATVVPAGMTKVRVRTVGAVATVRRGARGNRGIARSSGAATGGLKPDQNSQGGLTGVRPFFLDRPAAPKNGSQSGRSRLRCGPEFATPMPDASAIELKRDCDVVQIPHGSRHTLPKGTTVHLMQSLGGTFTVHAEGALFRIAGHDADAIGQEPPPPVAEVAAAAAGEIGEAEVWAVLRTCYDPEIPVNIVDLGLIYDLVIERDPAGGQQIAVKMTLTAPGCGMGATIAGDAQQKLLALPGVKTATVDVVWDPPWHQSMITGDGRRILGLE